MTRSVFDLARNRRDPLQYPHAPCAGVRSREDDGCVRSEMSNPSRLRQQNRFGERSSGRYSRPAHRSPPKSRGRFRSSSCRCVTISMRRDRVGGGLRSQRKSRRDSTPNRLLPRPPEQVRVEGRQHLKAFIECVGGGRERFEARCACDCRAKKDARRTSRRSPCRRKIGGYADRSFYTDVEASGVDQVAQLSRYSIAAAAFRPLSTREKDRNIHQRGRQKQAARASLCRDGDDGGPVYRTCTTAESNRSSWR